MPLRIDLSRMDNPTEADLLLKKRFGANNYGQDDYGQWWFTHPETGSRTAVFPQGAGLIETGKNVAAGMAATTPAMAGAMAGAGIGGALTLPAGGGGAIPGAMVGAAAGKGIDEAVKWFGGLFAKTPSEAVGTLGNEGAMAGVFQGAAPAMRAMGPTIQRGVRAWTGVTPQSAAMGGDLIAGGARPPISSVAPKAKALEYERGLRNTVMGDPVEAERIQYLDDRVQGVMRASGIPDDEIKAAVAQVQDKSANISARPAGQALIDRSLRIETGLAKEAELQQGRAQNALQQLDSAVRSWAQAPPDLADSVAGAIRADRRKFSEAMQNIYRNVDGMLGDAKIVPTDGIQRAARDIVDVMDPQAVPPILRRWASDEAPSHLSFEQAHNLRTTFREMADKFDVTPTGQKLGNVQRVARAVDETISELSNSADVTVKAAADALKQADVLYAKGIKQYNDVTMNKLLNLTKSGIQPDPGVVADTLVGSNNPAVITRLWGMLDDATKQGVRQADVASLIKQTASPDRTGKMVIDGKSLYQALLDRDATNAIIHGKRDTEFLKEVARRFAAYDGKMDIDTLQPGSFREALERSIGAKRAADEFARKNPRVALASNEPDMVDRAANFVIAPGMEARTEAAARMFGRDSPEWKAVERYAVQRLLNDAFVSTQSLGRRVSGPAIEQAFSKYTPRQQSLIFGDLTKADLRLLSQEAKFLFPEDVTSDLGTSLAGAATKGALPSLKGIRKYWWNFVSGWISDNPRVLKFLANEIRQDRPAARSTMSVLRQWFINSTLSGPGTNPPPMNFGEPPEEPAPEKTRVAKPTQESYRGP